MLDLKLITNENLDYAVNVENEIFPEYNAKNNYLKSIDNSSQSQFSLYSIRKYVLVLQVYILIKMIMITHGLDSLVLKKNIEIKVMVKKP